MNSGLRFLLVGGATTAATYIVYALALLWVSPMAAYLLALLAALPIQAGLMAPFVYKTPLTAGRAVRSVLIYLGYAALYALLMSQVLRTGIWPLAAPLVVIAIAAPLQYLAGWLWVRYRGPAAAGGTPGHAPGNGGR